MKFTLFVQKVLKITKTEAIIASILLLGLLAGYINKTFILSERIDNNNYFEVNQLIDSISKAERTTFIGTDIRGNAYDDLASSDTSVKKESFYPSKTKKEIEVGTLININTASRVQLMKLPGIGEKTAQRIIDYRVTNPFNSPKDIQNVKGIGPKKFEKMKAFIKI